MSDKCCARADVVSTHFEGCHTVHPECAAWRAGREAGMMEAAEIVNGSRADGADLRHVRDRILAAIGEGE